ncbi:polysaccharide deacetylase family protein [Dactylosporangium matsuzakiense]|uniref:Hydrolase n=1 Tax=Dactylosporangium matsuzakiense TaxID=53360 RepID=A0A9W6KMP6_9ACTN|nr:polysaccharide deacetylase family protein [Dactylosporangium matsuzakiense]UWZ40935.1 polysaccharide deacetylase family protein [Dactylosporangium matsuzakiense]GLL04861.1 hydrolase [Dactylosporangium matsuzakiense]
MSGAVSRRSLLLALGGVGLLAACGDGRAAWHDGQGIPGDSRPGEGGSPDPSASALDIPPANPPTPGVCPTPGGLGPKGPQYTLPCHGTDIALTVDDGPDPAYTPKMLALLAQQGIHATFCMIGRSAAAHPDLVKRVLDGGHHIANHTHSHPMDIAKMPAAAVHAELAKATDAISKASGNGYRPALFRSPGGAWSPTVLSQAGNLGLRALDWTVDPRDWSRPGVQHIVSTILKQTHPGSIILEHDGGGNRDQTLTALGIVLPRLRDAGYTFAQP